ncbi:MAG: hypothetical protein QF828_20155, partial [Pseudomonadales bacterium]|nr:hypothetical protein [Pseudomonadales bacterium]
IKYSVPLVRWLEGIYSASVEFFVHQMAPSNYPANIQQIIVPSSTHYTLPQTDRSSVKPPHMQTLTVLSWCW